MQYARPRHQSAPTRTAADSELEITRHEVALDYLPVEANGISIAQISDLHRGCGHTEALICEALAVVNSLEPDYIAVTGDFVDEHKKDVLPAVKMVVGLRARHGVYACLGNHDQRGDPVLLRSALEAGGITVLHNRAERTHHGFWFAGVDDIYEGEPDLAATTRGVPDDDALIYLAHNPAVFDQIQNPRNLLMLSGHTHGGQIVLPFPPPWMICRCHLHTRYVHGWYRRGPARLYVNRGLGVTGPNLFARRFRCAPEISVFRLTGKLN
jgi:predicted MPP superfamily phosphohydrolase